MSCPYTAAELSANVPSSPWSNWSYDGEVSWPIYFGSTNSSQDIGTFFQHFSVWDSEGRDIKYCKEWSNWCSDLTTIFKGDVFLLFCSLYPNITRGISNGQLGANWSQAGFNPSDTGLIRGLNSQIPSCLISYCALIPDCAATPHCLNANLYTSDGDISGTGMRTCWEEICMDWIPHVNSDFGGIGLSISYLMQTLIALLGFAVLASIHLRRHLTEMKKEKAAQSITEEEKSSNSSSKKAAHLAPLEYEKSHSGLLVLATEDFHKLQCYYSIALLIAFFVALYGGSSAEKAQLDEAFLMLISADGLVPVALTLYTLMLLDRTTLYHIVLTIISALLASATGFWIVKHYSLNRPITSEQWPDTCGALSPQYICEMGFELSQNYYPQIFFAVAAILCDILISYLVVWYALSRVKIESLARLKERLLPQGSRTLGLVKVMLHTLAVIILLACTLMELFFFGELFFQKYSIMDVNDWGFGQIVGITAWLAVIIDLARHEIALLWEHRKLEDGNTMTTPVLMSHVTDISNTSVTVKHPS